MGKSALLIIDTQINMVDESFSGYDGDQILELLSQLIDKARKVDMQIIFMRNNGSVGEPDEPGTLGWHIHSSVSPKSTDLVIDKDSPDSFAGTELQAELDNRDITSIIIAGMQTEMCIATSVEEANKRGFEVTLVEDGQTTFDWDEISPVDTIK
ncbi:MAG: isochorismatase family protein, partial [Chloroflexota bacterium]